MGDTHYGGVVASEGFKFGDKDSSATVVTALGGIVGPYSLKADDYTVTAAESGSVFGIATTAKTFTLPAPAAGLTYTFVNTGAATNNNVIVHTTTNIIFGTFTLALTIVIASAENTLTNTAGTSVKGDSVTLVSDGTAWYIIGSTGIWAATAP